MSVLADFRAYKENRLRLEAVLEWAKKHLPAGDRIRVQLPHLERDEASPALMVCNSGGLPGTEDWMPLFRSPAIEVWIRNDMSHQYPSLAWSASEVEKRQMLRIARKTAQHFWLTKKLLPTTALVPQSSRLHTERVSADVAYWVDGHLRASMIVENKPCAEAVATAAVKALHDARFKPLTSEELERARIEITIWSDLFIPLTTSEIMRGDIHFEKLYVATDGTRRGWYLPEVFNCVQFTGLTHFLDSLARQKGGFLPARASVHMTEVMDIIEASDHAKPLSLAGSVVRKPLPQAIIAELRTDIEQGALAAVRHLVSLQTEDGWMPGIIDPMHKGNPYAASWPRLTFMAWALGEWGAAGGSKEVLSSAEKLAAYCMSAIKTLPLSAQERVLCTAYLGKVAHAIGDEHLAQQQDILLQLLPTLPFEPISYLQAASFLMHVDDSAAHQAGKELFEKTVRVFLKGQEKGESLSLASYAELITLARELDSPHESDIREWYTSLQHADGSFPNTTTSHFAYSRGTGKVFEAMARYPDVYETQIVRSFEWLRQMQYTAESLFFVPESERGALVGGFRHDMNNPQAWVDASGHFLIGCARLLESLNQLGKGNMLKSG